MNPDSIVFVGVRMQIRIRTFVYIYMVLDLSIYSKLWKILKYCHHLHTWSQIGSFPSCKSYFGFLWTLESLSSTNAWLYYVLVTYPNMHFYDVMIMACVTVTLFACVCLHIFRASTITYTHFVIVHMNLLHFLNVHIHDCI